LAKLDNIWNKTVVKIAVENICTFPFPSKKASADPTIIPDIESGNVLNRMAPIQAPIFFIL
jgi:hypothetical protein